LIIKITVNIVEIIVLRKFRPSAGASASTSAGASAGAIVNAN